MSLRNGLSAILCGLVLAFPALAAEVATYAEVALDDVEIKAEVAVLPQPLREAVQRSEKSAENLVADLVSRRVIAARAGAEGLDQDPLIAARVKLAVERALYEAYMERAAEKAVDMALVEKLALDEYRAYPEKFRAGEEVRVRHILISACACAPEKGREQAEAVLARLKAGESFEEIAQKESADRGSAQKGGDLGFFPRGKMVAPFEEAAFAMNAPGELSELVESQFGFHIIRFEERKPGSKQAFDDVKEALMESIATKMRAAERLRIVGPIREPGAIKIDADALRSAVGQGS